MWTEKRNASLISQEVSKEVIPVKRSRRSDPVVEIEKCFFCEEIESVGRKLHKAITFQLDARVRKAAKDTNNTIFYAKIQTRDLVAQDAKYHSECLCKLHREANNSRIG